MSQLSDYIDYLLADLRSANRARELELAEALESIRTQLDNGSCEVVLSVDQARLVLLSCQPSKAQE